MMKPVPTPWLMGRRFHGMTGSSGWLTLRIITADRAICSGEIIGGATDKSPFFGLRHPTRPYYRGRPWFLPAGGLVFRALDKIGR